MKYLYLDRERYLRKEPSVAIRDDDGNIEYEDEVWVFWGRMRAPPNEPLTPKGPVAWVEVDIPLTVGRGLLVLGTLAFWGLVIWAIKLWMSP